MKTNEDYIRDVLTPASIPLILESDKPAITKGIVVIMAKYHDIEKICKKEGILIFPSTTEYELYHVGKILFISKEWSEGDYSDDNNYEVLYAAGKCKFDGHPESVVPVLAITWAIQHAKKLQMKITYRKLHEVESRAEINTEFDYTGIICDIPLKVMIDKYGLPLKVTMPRYYDDFYYVAESVDKKKHMIDGKQYLNGQFYRNKRYTYNEVCNLYDIEEAPPIVEKEDEDRKYNNSIKKRIQNKDRFDDVKANNDDLLNHQKAGFLLASRYDKFAFFYDTGTGKTVMALSIIKEKQEKEGASFLILAPKAIIKTAWLEDSANFFPGLRILPLSNNFYFSDCHALYERWAEHTEIPDKYAITEEEWKTASYYYVDYSKDDWLNEANKAGKMRNSVWERMEDLADHFIVNIEKFKKDPDAIMDYFMLDGLIVDESAILKNPESQNAKTLFAYADEFTYIYLLSGKPAPNNSTEYYAQMKLVDPNTFSMSFNFFKNAYFTGSGSRIMPISPKAEDDVANMVSVRSLIVSKEDCLSLPEMFQEIRSFELPREIMERYNRLYKFCIFELQANEKNKKGAYYSSVCKLAIFTKLREIASGFIVDERGDTVSFHDLKVKELEKIVKSHPNEQIIVWCQFSFEIKQVYEALSKYGTVVTAYGGTKNIDESIRQFKQGEARYIVAHPKSIKYGVTFVKCNIAVYYAMSYSAEDYYQSRDRIHRLGQTRMCTYYFIQAENTIDEIMYEAVNKKMSYAEIFAVIVKQAAKHGINYQEFKNAEDVPVKDELISTQLVKDKYDFSLVDDIQFTYKIDRTRYDSTLYNSLLKDAVTLYPEEILFEIGYAVKVNELEKKAEAEKKEVVLDFNDVIEVAKWVISEMSSLKIRRVQKVYDYLEEQIQKQYEYDVAHGAPELTDLDALAIKVPPKPTKEKKADQEKPKRFHFGPLGRAKKEKRSLLDIRHELDQVYFYSGKYRITNNCFCGDESVAHCHPQLGLIFQSKEDYESPTPEALFDLLHEIGHLENNNDSMSRQEEEYFATQWALERMKLYDFHLPRKRQKEFENYINSYSARRNKIIKSNNTISLEWED